MCFADKGDECSALAKKICKGCGFYKTKEQDQEDKQKVLSRLSRLGLIHLLDKYKTVDRFNPM